ncbi:aromatic ring-hydroxylating dioxygenase subunit alpha [Zavarzinia sp.]|uniref:aromatic ring-hydroxylating oxygenase subunit alpha n=1 Tax=Zavarzinia sp. TaxID=2027920 RepID=UPI00356360F1
MTAILDHLNAFAAGKIARSHAMPGAFYTDPALLEIEKEKVFRREWICIGHADEVKTPGDYFTTDLVGEPLLVTRNAAGEVNVLSNVCRHRGNIVAEGRGKRNLHVCAYHAWSYDRDGRLVRAPLMEQVADFDAAACSLPRIRSTVWQKFIFVNLDGSASPLEGRLAALEPQVRNYHNEERHLYFEREEVWATNWKCLAENFMEGYHLDATHPQTLKPVTPTGLCERVPGNGFFSAYKAHYTPESEQRRPFHPDLTPAEQRYSFLFSVFPAFVVTYMPHLTVYLCLRPVDTDHVAIRWGIAGHAETIPAEALAAHVKFADDFNAEDRVKLETLQRGLKSRFYRPGPLAADDLEGTIRDFYDYMARLLTA